MIDIKSVKMAVKNEKENRKAQEKLFKLGAYWNGKIKNIQYTNAKYLYCDSGFRLTYGESKYYFKTQNFREIKISDLFKNNSLKAFLEGDQDEI